MRAAGILLFCVFSSFLSTVTSLRCEQCVGIGSDCEETGAKEVECKEPEDYCSIIVFNSTITHPPSNIVIKECSTRELCLDGLTSTTTVDGRFEIARGHCCQTDLCNSELLSLEDYYALKPNGLKCPGCYKLEEDDCEANQTVNCVGEEDQCLTLSSTTISLAFRSKSTFHGCTAEKSCSYPVGPSLVAGGILLYNVTRLECRNATSPVVLSDDH
ncbi:phospholipase A2 inhibitor and Ly6/PLAUR domain-containing protein-like [Erythrolamprus reginae]|uniref:phospholipase A2 inhibitor and Ly6/PLAUR domain-containing protein-like n=1 Tax=Erythrolamprus reginae TaxID=121349 RepID=UPI00396CC5AB